MSVIIPTHAPHPGRLARTLDGLRRQSLPADAWEIIVVDNGSPRPVEVDLSGLPAARVVREDRLGLTFARLAGAAAASGRAFVFVDDDNVLDQDYLALAAATLDRHPDWGAVGGKSCAGWEAPPPAWVAEFAGDLAIRDLGDAEREAGPGLGGGYPDCSPVGAGMVIRAAAWQAYSEHAARHGSTVTDRRGESLASGGDCDIVLHLLKSGWKVGFVPGLRLTHLIPAGRTELGYLGRLNRGIAKSWVQVLDRHGIRPWPSVSWWSVPLRKWRAYFRYRAWAGPAEYVRWQGACGQFEGRAALAGVCR